MRARSPTGGLKDEGVCIERTFRFGTFREALAFVDDVGALAEAEGHHPDICFGWGYATVLVADEEDQRPARERLHHGRED
jgi:4a-hydroxytetrahydrobiopterin dehydratase